MFFCLKKDEQRANMWCPRMSLENAVSKITEKNKLFRWFHIGGAQMHCHREKESTKYQFTGVKVRGNY